MSNPQPGGPSSELQPLADRMRPRTLEEFVGQAHLLGPGKPLRRMIESGRLPSLVFWGPPGTGKTTLAHLIAARLGTHVAAFSAVLTGIKEVRDVMSDSAFFFEKTGSRTLLFIDEIHRFNKSQQDAFLPFLEKGQVLLVGTTTVNPSFDLNPALLSRLKVFTLHGLTVEDVVQIMARAEADAERGLGHALDGLPCEAYRLLARFSSGDARRALNMLEELSTHVRERRLAEPGFLPGEEEVREVLQRRVMLYDRDGEEHYNMLSALHKSMRNSDPDAAVYWVVRMVESGEDPRNVCRRVIQCAAEDVGLADPQALHLAVHAWQAHECLGLPESRYVILQAAVYNALAPKSNALLKAWKAASEDVVETAQAPVPMHLRNAPTRLMKDEGYGEGYLYAHDFPEGTTDMACLPPGLEGRVYFDPGISGLGQKIREKMEEIARRKGAFRSRVKASERGGGAGQ